MAKARRRPGISSRRAKSNAAECLPKVKQLMGPEVLLFAHAICSFPQRNENLVGLRASQDSTAALLELAPLVHGELLHGGKAARCHGVRGLGQPDDRFLHLARQHELRMAQPPMLVHPVFLMTAKLDFALVGVPEPRQPFQALGETAAGCLAVKSYEGLLCGGLPDLAAPQHRALSISLATKPLSAPRFHRGACQPLITRAARGRAAGLHGFWAQRDRKNASFGETGERGRRGEGLRAAQTSQSRCTTASRALPFMAILRGLQHCRPRGEGMRGCWGCRVAPRLTAPR